MSELSIGQLRGLTVNSNTVTVPAGHTLYAPGHVIQVVTVSSSTEVTSTSSSVVSTGLTALITPKSTSSRIAIFTTIPAQNTSTSSAAAFTLFRGTVSGVNLGTTAFSLPGFGGLYNSAGSVRSIQSIHHVDSPDTTAEIRYTVGFFPQSGGAVVMHEGRRGTLTLMEIAQ